MKRSISLLLVFLMVLTVTPFSVSASASAWVNGYDTTRYKNSLIMYTPENGSTTGTNDWGYEVVVEDGLITSAGTKGDNAIPENGFVLSGHGTKATWLETYAKIGFYAYYKNGVIQISDDTQDFGIFYSKSNALSGFNTGRGADMLVVYNIQGASSGTNEWGFEIVIDGGIVSSIGGNNNTVPSASGSFVLSGHGVMADWLRANAALGMAASYDAANMTVTLAYNENAILSGMSLRVKELRELYDDAIARYDIFDFDEALRAIDSLAFDVTDAKNDYLKTKNAIALQNAFEIFEEKCDAVSLMICESKTSEYRAIWVRPTQTTAKDVDDYVERLYQGGMNTICLETLIDSCMIMPMPKDSLFEHHPKFGGFDVLQAYIDSCHKRNMELHVWMPVFYVGDGGSYYVSKSVGMKKPEWLSVSSTGLTTEVTDGFIMLDPANREAKDFLLSSYKYILEQYDIDSFQLDYIRYTTRSATLDMGYSETALKEFKEIYGVVPKFDTTSSYWNTWVGFRSDYISDFVLEIKLMMQEVAPDVLLAADVVPDSREAKNYNYQEFTRWVNSGWIDVLFPMAYNSAYQSEVSKLVTSSDGKAFVAAGLGIYMDEYDAMDMQSQSLYNNLVGTDGSAFFESYYFLKKNTGSVLTNGVFRESAVTPTFDMSLSAKNQLAAMVKRIEDIIIPLSGFSENDGRALVKEITKFSNSFTDDGYSFQKLADLKTAINGSALDSVAKQRLLSDLETVTRQYEIKHKTINPDGTIGDSKVTDMEDFAYGDVDRNGDINASDYVITKRAVMGTIELDSIQMSAADISDDGEITAADYVFIKRHVMGTYLINN